jgi:CO/xanthine dehydrogenase Mo-binding subunit
MCGFALYDLPNVSVVGYDVVSNRPKVAAYRAPGAPITSSVESLIDDLARKMNIDPLTLREKNAAKNGTKTHYGVSHTNIGFEQVLAAVKSHPHWKTPVKEGHGRGMACGFWFNVGGESSANVHVNEDGSVTVATGSPDIGGSRASMGMMVAEVLGIPANRVRATVADTASIGFTHVTGGSRVTFATGMAATQAAEKVVEDLKKRAARIWEIPVDAVEWKDGKAFPAGSNAGAFDPLDLPAIALKAAKTGGPVSAEVSLNAQGAGAGFGIKGQLDNPGFLDYRCPVASDVPMIEAVLVEVPNPRHPFGARGVGEVPIVPPMAAIANAIRSATGLRMPDLPISPPKLRAALDAAG